MAKLTKEQAKTARRELGDFYGKNGFSMVVQDTYYARSLETKYGMALSQLEIASGYRTPPKPKTDMVAVATIDSDGPGPLELRLNSKLLEIGGLIPHGTVLYMRADDYNAIKRAEKQAERERQKKKK